MKLKKLAGVVLAGVMVCTMGMSALAAGSPEAKPNGSATDKNGNPVEVKITDPETVPSAADVKNVLGGSYVEGMEVVAVGEVKVAPGTEFPVTITFAYDGVNASTKVAVLNYQNGAWVSVPATAGENTVTATFDHLSPVALVVDTATMTPSASTNKPNTNPAGTKSPNTGEGRMVVMLGIVAVAAVGGAFALSKKKAA